MTTKQEKALSTDSKKSFVMNFQQIKPGCCDVFVWVAVWRDAIKYRVLSSQEVKNNPYYFTRQHRGNVGEGRIHVKDTNVKEFKKYEVAGVELVASIRAANNRSNDDH